MKPAGRLTRNRPPKQAFLKTCRFWRRVRAQRDRSKEYSNGYLLTYFRWGHERSRSHASVHFARTLFGFPEDQRQALGISGRSQDESDPDDGPSQLPDGGSPPED